MSYIFQDFLVLQYGQAAFPEKLCDKFGSYVALASQQKYIS